MSEETQTLQRTARREYATLTVSGHSFCIGIEEIRATRRWSEVTILPHSPSFVLGAMNLRGIIIPIIDLSEKLGFGAATLSDRHVIVIIENSDQTIGLVADSVQEILSVESEQVHQPPSGAQSPDSCVSGLVAHNEDMIRVIDTSLILESIGGVLP